MINLYKILKYNRFLPPVEMTRLTRTGGKAGSGASRPTPLSHIFSNSCHFDAAGAAEKSIAATMGSLLPLTLGL